MTTESSCIVTSRRKCGRARPAANSPCSPVRSTSTNCCRKLSLEPNWTAGRETCKGAKISLASGQAVFRIPRGAQAESYEKLAEMSALKNREQRGERDAKNYSVLVVRRPGRRSDEFLYFNFQEFKSWESHSIWRRRTRTERNGNVCDVPARGTRIHGPKRRSAIQVHASDIVLRELRDAARSGRTVGEAFRGRSKRQMRLAQR